MIKLQNITKSFGSHAVLQDISLEVSKGETVALIGPSGCGKSTLLKCINGLVQPDSGRVLIEGVNIQDKNIDINSIRAEIGIVFQQFNLFPHMTVKENIMLAPVKVKKMPSKHASQLAEMLLEKVGIIDKINKYPDELSGGQAQRVAIARSLAMSPEIMLFDEPTSALDPRMTNEVLDVMKGLLNDGMTMIVVSHELGFVKDIAKRIVFLSNGKIIEEGTPEKIFENPKHELTRDFVKDILKLEI